MKMTRQDLKGIVKECLIEILSEGLTSTQNSINESRGQRQHLQQQQQPPPREAQRSVRSVTADKISFLPRKDEIRSAASAPSNNRPQNLARSITSDPVLADILADTARSGMHTKMNESATGVSHEQMVSSAGDVAAKTMLRSDPRDIFGESAEKWASLAFAEKIPGRS